MAQQLTLSPHTKALGPGGFCVCVGSLWILWPRPDQTRRRPRPRPNSLHLMVRVCALQGAICTCLYLSVFLVPVCAADPLL